MKKFALSFLFIILQSNTYSQKIERISIFETDSILKYNNSIVLIDARSESMFRAGHIPNAINIDAYKNTKDSIVNLLDREIEYLIYCSTHRRVDTLVNVMKKNGFSNIYRMDGGFEKWEINNLPIEKDIEIQKDNKE